ncbi:MAG: urea ABC transporter permease subunit UrtB [Actinomycetota bacterium]|nr:urea ABC transporter permease subunit UrtB [Actinomycetota bacterium]
METFLEQLFNGLSLASVLLLIALGLTFTFGQMGVINMAHGEFIMAGAYAPYVLQTKVGFLASLSGVAFAISLPVAFVVAGVLGLVVERLLLRRMYGRPLDTLLVTFGVALVLQQVAKDLFGAPNVEVRTPSALRGNVEVLGVTMPYTRLFIMGLVIVVVSLVWVFMAKLAQGRRMRAVMENRDLAAVSGLPTRKVDGVTFFIGSGLAGIAGVAISLIGSIGFQIGTTYIIDAFLVVVVGGVGKLRGAILAALGIGIVNAYSEYATSASIGKAIVFVCVIVFLQFRPNGLVTLRTRGLTA